MQGKAVFISYSHDSDEHREKVLGLAERLRQDGLDARLDQYVNGTPEQGWPRWMLDRLDEAGFVLIVCTETYYRRFRGHEVPGRGKGVAWEGALITQEIYDARSRTVKFVPVMLTAGQEPFVPEPLRGHTHYELTSEAHYQALYDFLLGQAGIEPRPLGAIRPVPKRVAQPLTFGPSPEPPPPTRKSEESRSHPVKRPARSRLLLLAAVPLLAAIGLLTPAIRQWLEPSKKATDQPEVQAEERGTPTPVEPTCFPGKRHTENGIDFVRVCPGTFTMGSAENDPLAQDDEKPAHSVTLSEFWIGRTEITNAEYRRFQSKHQGEVGLPATGITWTEAKAACEHFGGRLPTEAEWEYAARAGSQSAWSFGDDEKMLGGHAWYGESSASTPHSVGTKKPNDWGLYDMHGNVWEWVADWYTPYEKGPQSDPAGPKTGERRVLRGGAFVSSPWDLRSAVRDGDLPEVRYWFIGFRCARGPRRQP